MRRELEEAVAKIKGEELTAANKEFAQFNSTHEGYAVILEEAQETEEELRSMAANLQALWQTIRQNKDAATIEQTAEGVELTAQALAAEAIQTAAMARKMIDYLQISTAAGATGASKSAGANALEYATS
jgi:Ribonuclease G/E